MRNGSRWVGAAFVAGASVMVAEQAGAQLVNGSFEQGTFVPDLGNLDSLPVGSTAMTGWTTVTDELAWARDDNPFIPNPSTDGIFSLDLTGFQDAAPYGGVTQDVATVPAQAYVLSFDLSSFESDFAFRGPVGVTASADAVSAPFVFTPPVGSTGLQSGRFNLPFVATDAMTTITIQGTLGINYIGLDNVTLVPEPHAVAVLALGGLALTRGFARRRGA